MARPITNTRDMPDSLIDARHLSLLGTNALKYVAGTVLPRCALDCGLDDVPPYNRGGEPTNHRCWLGAGHTEPCEWSSECGGVE